MVPGTSQGRRIAPGGPLLGLQAEQLAGRIARGGCGTAPVGPADALHQPGAVADRGPAGNLGADRKCGVGQGLGAGRLGRPGGRIWCRVGGGGDGFLQQLAGREAGPGLPAGILGTADSLNQAVALRRRLSGPRGWARVPGLQHLPGWHRSPIADNDHGTVFKIVDTVPHGPLRTALIAQSASGLGVDAQLGAVPKGSRPSLGPKGGRRPDEGRNRQDGNDKPDGAADRWSMGGQDHGWQ